MDKVIIDLFAGCGGLSTGYELAGFNIPLAVEKDDWASETYRFNHPNTKVITGDITQITDLDSLLPKGTKVDGIGLKPTVEVDFILNGNEDNQLDKAIEIARGK